MTQWEPRGCSKIGKAQLQKVKVEVLAQYEELLSTDKIDRMRESRPDHSDQGVLVRILVEPHIVF